MICRGPRFGVPERGMGGAPFGPIQAPAARLLTTIYFTQRAENGSARAMTVSVAVVGGVVVLCLGLVWLLPLHTPPDAGWGD